MNEEIHLTCGEQGNQMKSKIEWTKNQRKVINEVARVNMFLGGIAACGILGFIAAVTAALFDFTIVLTF